MCSIKHTVVAVLNLFAGTMLSVTALWIPPCLAEDIAITEQNIIRNGDFEQDRHGWHTFWCDTTSLADKDGDYGMRLDHLGESHYRYTFQKLNLPSELSSATIQFDYRVFERNYFEYTPIVFDISIGTSTGFDSENLEVTPPLTMIGSIHSETITNASDWKAFQAKFPQTLIDAMQTAHAAGEFVFLFMSQTNTNQEDDPRNVIDIDNLSFNVSGIQRVPNMTGKIAYWEDNDEDEPYALNILNPNTNQAETIWSHPEDFLYSPREVAWRPDATEIAFSSDHEHLSSPFGADIYVIKPNGSQLRKITGPSQADINDSNLPRVTVNGRIRNDIGGPTAALRNTIIVTIQGVEDGRMLIVEEGESVPFTIADVPVLGEPDTFTQPVTMIFWNSQCAGGVEYHFPIAPVANGSVDLGTINFFGFDCMSGQLGNLVPRDLTWKHDGSEIGFRMLGFKKVPSTFSEAFGWTSIEPDGGVFGNSFTWSPVDDRYLYCDYRNGTQQELYITEEGGDPLLLLDDHNDWTQPAWLPDASGFIYIGQPSSATMFDDNIFYFDLGTGQRERLTYFRFEVIENLSISPTGQYIVFEMRDTVGKPYASDLWIMDRSNPTDIWRVTHNGSSTKPNWSRKSVPQNGGPDADNDGDGQGDTGGSDSGGGGGCFVSCCTPKEEGHKGLAQE